MEDPVSHVQVPEETASAAHAGRRLGCRHGEQCAREARTNAAGRGEVAGGDAPGGGDEAQGQVHNVRPEGEEIQKECSQYVNLVMLALSFFS